MARGERLQNFTYSKRPAVTTTGKKGVDVEIELLVRRIGNALERLLKIAWLEHASESAREKIRDLLEKLLKALALKRKKRAIRLAVYEEKKGEEITMQGKDLPNTSGRRLFIVPKDDQDKKDSVQKGTMIATSRDESVATVALDPANELEAIVTPVKGASGDAGFDFKADADMTEEGIVEVVGEYTCKILDKMASILTIEEGEDFPLPDEVATTSTKKKP